MIYPFLLKNVIFPLGSILMGGKISKKIAQLKVNIRLPLHQIEQLQQEKLAQILNYAANNSPYYRSYFSSSDCGQNSINLSYFPILTKQLLREKIDDIVTVSDKDKLYNTFSSGSTGPPSNVYYTKEELAIPRAIQLIWWSWADYDYGNSILQTGVNLNRSKEKKIKDFFFITKYIEALKHQEKDIIQVLLDLKSNPKDHFVGYASSLYLFSKVALEHNIESIKFKSVISLGEKLLPNFRESIEKAFKCKVYDTYGSSEGLMVAAQCKMGTYHIMTPHVVVEIVNEKGEEVAPGETGSLLLTGLDNFTTPLIRYEIGDMAVKGFNERCQCGLELPALGEVLGRSTEFIVTPNKKYITVQTVVRVLKFFPEIDQFTLIHTETGLLELQYISDQILTSDFHKKIHSAFEDLYSEPLNMEFKKVKKLPKTKSGKFQLILNQTGKF